MRPLAAMLFDLDGTLTKPVLDFPAIKRELGLPVDQSILDSLAQIAPARRPALLELLHRREREAALAAEPNSGAAELIAWLDARQISVGVVTRNAREFALMTLERIGLKINVVVARECATPKPNPAGVLLACERLGVAPASTWMVGDYADDLLAGAAAGCAATVLMTNHQTPTFAHSANHVVACLADIPYVLPFD